MKLEQVRRIALALPAVTEGPHFHLTSFRVAGKIFATAPPEQVYLHVFVDEEQRRIALALDPASTEELLWGERVSGLRITLSKAKPALVRRLLEQAWTRRAPKRLLAEARQAGRLDAP